MQHPEDRLHHDGPPIHHDPDTARSPLRWAGLVAAGVLTLAAMAAPAGAMFPEPSHPGSPAPVVTSCGRG